MGIENTSDSRTYKMFRLLVAQLQSDEPVAPCATREEWEQLLAANRPAHRDLLAELARFADLWRYFGEQEESLGSEIVGKIRGLYRLPVEERTSALKAINQALIRRLNHAGESARLRQ
jgi:hypothetical protein